MGGPIRFVYLDGAGMAPTRRILEKSPLYHGAIDRGFRLEPRELTLRLALDGRDPTHADQLRDQISYYFAPTNNPLKLRAVRDDRTVRQIDCYVNGEVDYPQSNRIGALQEVSIPLLAPDPTWYFPTQQTTTLALVNGSNSQDITVSGLTWDEWPIIDIRGAVDASAQLRHQGLNLILQLQTAIPDGETFRFDLRPGYRTVVRTSDNANRMNYILPSTIAVLSDMRILSEKATRAVGGGFTTTNRFNVIVNSGATANSQLQIFYYKRYLSL
jgi:hypothetical protein